MGLFDMFKKKAAPAAPKAVVAQEAAGIACAPASGEVVELAVVGDPLFSTGAMGKGCGIKPEGEVVYAPVSGTVTALIAQSKHAAGIASDDGAEILIHVGVDTVSMQGEGFAYLVSEGQRVKAGDPLLTFCKSDIAAAGYSDTVIMVVTNTDDLASVELVASGAVKAGEPVLKIAK